MAKPHATTKSTTSKPPNYYTILNLSTRKHDPTLTPSEVKAAYKKALLQHHPDKKLSSPSTTSSTSTSTPQTTQSKPNNKNITIDSIALAYKILSSPALKAEYDSHLQTSRRSHNNTTTTNNSTPNPNSDSDSDSDSDEIFRTGLETVDLDDLHFVETNNNKDQQDSQQEQEQEQTWTRACRCGDEAGFAVTETDLDANAEDGEVIVGCRGCSLWLRVLFGVEG